MSKYTRKPKPKHQPTAPPWIIREAHGQYEIISEATDTDAEHLVATVCCSKTARPSGRNNLRSKAESLSNAQQMAASGVVLETLRMAIAYLNATPHPDRTKRLERIVATGKVALSAADNPNEIPLARSIAENKEIPID